MLEARAGNLASGVPEYHVPYSTCSCTLAFGNVGLPARATSAAAASVTGAYRNALSQGVFASKHASRGTHLPARAMRA